MERYERTLFQTYFALVWWHESIKSNFFESDFFKEMNFNDSFVKGNLKRPGVAQGALLLPSLYVSLVMPKETIFRDHEDAFKKIDLRFREKIIVIENSYPNEIKITRHLRNATAHSAIHINGNFLEFSDIDVKNNYRLNAKISLSDASLLVSDLQRVILAHVEVVKSRQSESAS